MAYYVILDVTIHDLARYQEYMLQVKPMIEAACGQPREHRRRGRDLVVAARNLPSGCCISTP
jgi:uncharacterized protein (DUF1330 family)